MKTIALGALAVMAVIGLEFGPGFVSEAQAQGGSGDMVVEYADMGLAD